MKADRKHAPCTVKIADFNQIHDIIMIKAAECSGFSNIPLLFVYCLMYNRIQIEELERGKKMEKTIGLAELTSITYGIAVSDAMLKAGSVKLIRSAPACPGKYLILIAGDTGEVKAAMEAGRELAGTYLRASYVIPHIHEQVLETLSAKKKPEPREALGILESSRMVSAIYAADMVAKEAAVHLCRIRLGQGIGGKGVVLLSGDVGAVEAAVKAAAAQNEALDLKLTEHYVIPNPDPELLEFL